MKLEVSFVSFVLTTFQDLDFMILSYSSERTVNFIYDGERIVSTLAFPEAIYFFELLSAAPSFLKSRSLLLIVQERRKV